MVRMWLVWVLVTAVKIAVAVALGVTVGWGWMVVVLGLACVSTVLAVLDWRSYRARHGRRPGGAAVHELTDVVRPIPVQRADGSPSLFDAPSDTGPFARTEPRHRRVG
jgi:membrane protein implicated in regulation of membrane protease activity